MTVLLACLVLRAQEPDIHDLIRRLSSDSIETRDRAQRRLSTMSLAAEKALRDAAVSGDPEAVARIRPLLKAMDDHKAEVLDTVNRLLDHAVLEAEKGETRNCRALCREILAIDPAYAPARELLAGAPDAKTIRTLRAELDPRGPPPRATGFRFPERAAWKAHLASIRELRARIGSAQATVTKLRTRRVTVRVENGTLRDVVDSVAAQIGVRLVPDDDVREALDARTSFTVGDLVSDGALRLALTPHRLCHCVLLDGTLRIAKPGNLRLYPDRKERED